MVPSRTGPGTAPLDCRYGLAVLPAGGMEMGLGCLRAWGWKRQRGHRNPARSYGESCGGQCHIIVFVNRSSFILKLARASVPSSPIRRLFQSLIPLLSRNNVIAQIYSWSVQSHLFLCQYCSLAQTALLNCTMGSRFQFL